MRFLNIESQTEHALGGGIGIYANSQAIAIYTPNFELQYSLKYKILFAKLNTMYMPVKTAEFINLSQTSFFFGVRNKPPKKAQMHFAVGIRNMYSSTNKDSKVPENQQVRPQINFCANIGIEIAVSDKHRLYLENYYGFYRINKYIGHSLIEQRYPDASVTIGYSYKLN